MNLSLSLYIYIHIHGILYHTICRIGFRGNRNAPDPEGGLANAATTTTTTTSTNNDTNDTTTTTTVTTTTTTNNNHETKHDNNPKTNEHSKDNTITAINNNPYCILVLTAIY